MTRQEAITNFLSQFVAEDQLGKYLPIESVDTVAAALMKKYTTVFCGAETEDGFLFFTVCAVSPKWHDGAPYYRIIVRTSDPGKHSITEFRQNTGRKRRRKR